VSIDDNFLDKEWTTFRAEMIGMTINGASKESIAEVIRAHLKKEKIFTVTLDEGGYLNPANTDNEQHLSGWLMLFQVWRMSELNATFDEVKNYTAVSDTIRADMEGMLTTFLLQADSPVDSIGRGRVQHAKYWISLEKSKYDPAQEKYRCKVDIVEELATWKGRGFELALFQKSKVNRLLSHTNIDTKKEDFHSRKLRR
jgi:hypothetical protein